MLCCASIVKCESESHCVQTSLSSLNFKIMISNTKSLTSCDTFVVLPPCTSKNVLIFGKNSDRPAGEVQEVVYCPRKSYSSGAQIEVSEMSVMM